MYVNIDTPVRTWMEGEGEVVADVSGGNARVFHQLELETPPGPEVKHLQELKPVLLLIFELNCRLTSQDE